jgi:predicted Ser/Thr protein kinase
MSKVYVKKPKPRLSSGGISRYSGLNKFESFQLEVKCLQLLEQHYVCTCGHGVKNYHFPRIIDTDKGQLRITMTWAGETIKDLIDKHIPFTIPDKDKQINCIFDNLQRAGVYHIDMHTSGKNLCLANKETLALIDFDIARYKVDDKLKPSNFQIKKRANSYKHPSYRSVCLEKIRQII